MKPGENQNANSTKSGQELAHELAHELTWKDFAQMFGGNLIPTSNPVTEAPELDFETVDGIHSVHVNVAGNSKETIQISVNDLTLHIKTDTESVRVKFAKDVDVKLKLGEKLDISTVSAMQNDGILVVSFKEKEDKEEFVNVTIQ